MIALPTTYGGSEVTPFYGYTEGGIKRGKRDPKMMPKTVIYDPELTTSLPPACFRTFRNERDRPLR